MAFNVTSAFYYDDASTKQTIEAGSIIPNGADIYLAFSDDIASASVLSYTVSLFRTLSDGGNETPVDISSVIVVNDGSGNPTYIKIDPASDLLSGGNYTLYLPKGRYGIRSINGETLQYSYSTSFLSETLPSGAGPSVPEDTTELPAIPPSLYLISSMPLDESIMQYGTGSVIAKFNGRLPEDETAPTDTDKNVVCSVEVRHPLGLSLNINSNWADNFSSDAIGSELFLTSKIDEASIDITKLMVLGEDTITTDGIACINKTSDSNGNIALDFDVNKIFEVSFSTPFNDAVDPISFMGLLWPFFTSIEETKLEIGPFVQQYDDFTLALLIYRHSITAEQLWKGALDYAMLPTRIAEYVQARTKRDILNTYLTDPAGASSNFSIGDFKMSGKDLSRYLQDSIKAIDLKIIALENALKKGDSSADPYTDHRHQSLPVQTKGVVTGGSVNSNTLFNSRALSKGG
jgi:hypothetical protein